MNKSNQNSSVNQNLCPECSGDGHILLAKKTICSICNGFGQITEVRLNRYRLAKALNKREASGIVDFPTKFKPEVSFLEDIF